MMVPLAKSPTPVFSSSANTGPLATNATVTAGFAPASAFSLDVNGVTVPRADTPSWTPSFQLGTYASAPTGTLVLHRLPLNGLLALVTLLLWLLMWLGFGWVHRLEWLFTGRRHPTHARHGADHE
jgi:hypothetical protein